MDPRDHDEVTLTMCSYQSNLFVYLVLVTTFIVLHLAQAQSDVYQENESKRTYCGRGLAEAIAHACYNIPQLMVKRSGEDVATDDYPYAYDYPLRSRSSANAMMGRFGGATFRRQIRGVVDECCDNPCSISVLQSYCER